MPIYFDIPPPRQTRFFDLLDGLTCARRCPSAARANVTVLGLSISSFSLLACLLAREKKRLHSRARPNTSRNIPYTVLLYRSSKTHGRTESAHRLPSLPRPPHSLPPRLAGPRIHCRSGITFYLRKAILQSDVVQQSGSNGNPPKILFDRLVRPALL